MQTVKTERVLRILIGILLVVLGYVIVDSFEERIVVVGDTAPDFTVTTDSGRQVTRSDFGGKLLVLNFWATWCPPCVEEMPSLDQFQKRLAGDGVVVLGVSVDKSEQAYRQFLRKAKVSFLTARNPSAEISAEYGTFKYPETYLIDGRGKVVLKHIGPRDWSDERLINEIRSLL
ncbi:MAG TPA: TlpA disulfide reductase family protein [Bryobacteraceae bacterium]|nr:TlpA disulfide reductase family protein [Bryobacteraceae bacterium]